MVPVGSLVGEISLGLEDGKRILLGDWRGVEQSLAQIHVIKTED